MFRYRCFKNPGRETYMVQVLKDDVLATCFHSGSPVSAEFFHRVGERTIVAYLGLVNGSVMKLMFLDIGFHDLNPKIKMLYPSNGQPVTHIVSDGSAILLTSKSGITTTRLATPKKKDLSLPQGLVKMTRQARIDAHRRGTDAAVTRR
ncbi:hypothetical protein B0H11DRAFT_2280944 [Mycena galericulata]|nr:hypothetical protein B0H11DRAFT_2280944 [Mycena galericulata]